MLVNKLLLSVAVKDSDIAVEALYHSLELEAVGKDYSYHYLVFSALIKEHILQIDSFVHTHTPFSK